MSPWGINVDKDPKEMTKEEREIEMVQKLRDLTRIMKKIESHLDTISQKKTTRYD